MRLYTNASVGCFLLGMLGCGDIHSRLQPGDAADGSAQQTDMLDDPSLLPCTDDDSVELGAKVLGEEGLVSAVLVDADPWPAESLSPVNNWTVQLVDSRGRPLSQASIASAKSFDRLHGIGKSLESEQIVPQSEPATFRLEGLHFLLHASWQVSIEVTSPAGDDFISLPVCVLRDPS